jgi:hypothetical protein
MVDRRDTRQRVLFIGGLGRSGSTLVEKLLNELPSTFAIGETVHLWERGVRDHERCGCGEPFTACPHWRAVGEEAFGSWDAVDLGRMIELRWTEDRSRRLPQIFKAVRTGRISAAQQEYLDGMRAVLLGSAAVAAQDRGVDPHEVVLLDSSKHLSTAALLACDPRLDVRVLHLLRDPRGVAHSWMKTIERPETEGEIMPRYSAGRTAGRWVTDNLGFDVLASLGIPTLRLRYEDVLASPERRMLDIARFAGALGADREPSLGFINGTTAHLRTPMHSIAGNPLRFGGAHLELRIDDAWRSALPAGDRRTVELITRPVLGRFGYQR